MSKHASDSLLVSSLLLSRSFCSSWTNLPPVSTVNRHSISFASCANWLLLDKRFSARSISRMLCSSKTLVCFTMLRSLFCCLKHCAFLDRLLLLQRGGETVYFGDIGPNAEVLTDYFARHGAVCPEDVNPAEFMLEAIGNGSRRRIGTKDWAEVSWNHLSNCYRTTKLDSLFCRSILSRQSLRKTRGRLRGSRLRRSVYKTRLALSKLNTQRRGCISSRSSRSERSALSGARLTTGSRKISQSDQ